MIRRVTRIAVCIVFGCVVLVGGIWLLAHLLDDVQTNYEGKTISDWVASLHSTDAVVANGAKIIVVNQVIPALCQKMFNDTNDSTLKLKLVDQLNLLPHVFITAAQAPTRRYQAAQSLGEFGADAASAIPDLIRCVNGKDGVVRGGAIEALGLIRTDPSTVIPLLIQCLDDSDEDIKVQAAEALGEYGSQAKSAVQKLLPLLKFHSKELPPTVRKSLGQIDPSALLIKVPEYEPPALIKPALPTDTGLLLQPPLDLSKFSTEEFTALSSTVGLDRIHKKWTSAVVVLPPHARADAHGLTEQEVKDYMLQARRLFDEGAAIPISDAGLISTQEDVIRRPMLNHISAFSNSVARVYLLVQKTSTDKGWGYFSIVQDLTIDPPLDYFADLNQKEVRFEGISCYKCHSSGPLAIHPARADLVSDAPLAAAISKHIARQPMGNFYFPTNEVRPVYGKPLALEFCTKCHDTDGIRSPLFKVHSHPIRILVDFGYMPPKHPLTASEIAELKAWLDEKP